MEQHARYNGGGPITLAAKHCSKASGLSTRAPATELGDNSNALLQRCHSEGLHHFGRWLRLHHDHLPEDLPLAGLRRRLVADLEHTPARDDELADTLQLLCYHRCKVLKQLLADRRLHFGTLDKGSHET